MSQARPPHSNLRAAGHLEDEVDAMSLAMRGSEIEQSFAMTSLPRVSEYVSQPNAQAHLFAKFRNLDGRVLIDGEVTAQLQMRCQRCLQPVTVPVDDEFSVVLVGSEDELDKMAPEQDAIVAQAERLDLRWLTEEQLLLAAPLVPLHATNAECGLAESPVVVTDESAPSTAESQRPFADLREMLKNR
jgi:uncharacterized protein